MATTTAPTPQGSSGDVIESTFQALAQSFAMIIFSEIGDKTFLIAAILAMRHPRLVVFAGAFGSLVVMSCLSAAMGHLLPTLIPRTWTQFAASLLFLVFGAKMFMEAREMKAGNDKIQEEMREAEEEIEEDEAVHDGTGSKLDGHVIPLEEMEEGGRISRHSQEELAHPRSPASSRSKSSSKTSWSEGARNFSSLLFGPVFVQAFVLTFLGEWGDRSQIATIALGAAHVSCYQSLSSLDPPAETYAHHAIECLSSYIRHRGRTFLLHGIGCNWRKIRVYQNICEARYVSPFLSYSFAYKTLAGS